MPEMRFHIRWPDGAEERCYSPSLVVKEHLVVGESYPVADFAARSRTALNIASERVRAIYGRPCGLALAQRDRIETTAERFYADAGARVAVLGFED
ncbi:MSMEG_0570 family nitrogen starvation response protein [Chenggangzhangella methanolivorans]|uniref:MSMEG_0570 family nitrogen starvation response protein n=1 Tax=Chenggangzhangella methanolivorans TaxID=1437009 RepID=A0A9E6R8F0_9HYPH|nr:MSMEG_0570 family nitrogen starvation response protein [Chenggangzhangella methanolivorans]QZN99396.1 MSMEG_0570 family nitrogen starvation response protein [Chenggangzhangella methanolivorans]